MLLLLLLTALAPFVQTAADTEGALQETATGEIVAVTPTGTPVPGPYDNTDPGEEPVEGDVSDLNDTNGNVCTQGQNGCEMPGTASEEEIFETSADPENAGNNDPTDLSYTNSDEDQAAPASRLVSASAVTWHMNFNVDCVSAGCIAVTDRTVGMYVSACNDGGGEYRNIAFTPVDQTGKFTSYSVYQGDYPVFTGADTILIPNPSSSFSYGPLPPHRCVTAMFESEITTPPADHTEYKRFEYRLTADNGESVQSTAAYADKYGCYVPSGSASVSASVKENPVCIDPGADIASYEILISNTGSSDICGTTVTADRPGKFHLKNSTDKSDVFVYDLTLYTEDYFAVIFEEDLTGATLTAGGSHQVNFSAAGESCAEGSPVKTAASGEIKVCAASTATYTPTFVPTSSATAVTEATSTPTSTPVPTGTPAPTQTATPVPDPGIQLDLTVPSDCSDPSSEEPDRFTLTLTNNGTEDFCRVVIKGPDGSVLSIQGQDESGSTLAVTDLKSGQSVLIDALYKSSFPEGSYTVRFSAEGFTVDDDSCTDEPAASAEAEAEIPACSNTPMIDTGINTDGECHVYSGDDVPDEFNYEIKNPGNIGYCMVSARLEVIVKGNVVQTEYITIPADDLPAGGTVYGTYPVVPENIAGLLPGDTYTVRITAFAGAYDSRHGCAEEPDVTAQASAEKTVCPDIKPVITVSSLNPACIDAGDTLKFKGLVDIDPHSSAERITVNTGTITWGGTSYSCEITSVKKSADTDFTAVPDDEKGTSYAFENFGHGSGAVGFICEAKTSDNEQMRNGRTLSFNASAVVSSAGYVGDYQITSDTVYAAQKCSYTHTTLLPNTGDETNMPVLIGLFSLFLICGGASSFMLIRKKKPVQIQEEQE